MPPKNKSLKKKTSHDDDEEVSEACAIAKPNMADTNVLPNSLESFLDQRMTQQSKQLQDLFSQYSKNTQDGLQQVKTSQEFISGKFDEVLKAINELKSDYNLLRDENIMLKQRVNELQNKIAVIDNDCEGLKQYSRRDLLEVHGIPQNLEENTDNLVQHVAQLAEINLDASDISISHRLPAKRGKTAAVIVKFTRRKVRDTIYNNRYKLRGKTTSDLGFTQSNRIYINESFTAKGKQLFYEVKTYQKSHNFKYIWSRNGNVYLRKNDDHTTETIHFKSLKEFEEFKENYAIAVRS